MLHFIPFRAGIFDTDKAKRQLASPTNLVLGTFMLWWGWLGFNCGSTFGVSGGKYVTKYKLNEPLQQNVEDIRCVILEFIIRL